MLVLMAIIGDEKKAGYGVVRGTAAVDPATGENHFRPEEAGRHSYVIKERDNAYYADAIDERIRSR